MLKQGQTPAVLSEVPSPCTESRADLPRARVAVPTAAFGREGRRYAVQTWLQTRTESFVKADGSLRAGCLRLTWHTDRRRKNISIYIHTEERKVTAQNM